MTENTDEVVRRVLADTRVWAVVGLSENTARAAYGVAAYLRQHGRRTIPVHPSAPVIDGEQGYPTLRDIPFPVDVVDLFVRSDLVGPVIDEAVKIGAGAVWTQLGVRDEAAQARAREAGLDVVVDACPRIEGPRLLAWY
ncbi:CoA-binding protein [Parafrankia colletiae]|uniref:CoA-binding protein n=1 Tax=Parafrankia colletiae TaxID=573497 RepID=A0A1S1RI45_9ACTN|nr:CoA-binding protein [Parafrankia colletiae]MCK9901208.1 CoA-binding protein [Frankia sp. Cpl3]OHV46468.1 CoA-binding protein [Parafrankia colletiae]